MAEVDEKVRKAVFESLNRSGFTFQTAVTHAMSRSGARWGVYASEYPWRDADGRDNFLDIVATNGQFILTVECKKTSKEILTFLLPLGMRTTGDVDEFQCVFVEYNPKIDRISPEWMILNVWPRSPSCEFCIVSTSDLGRDQRLLERDASLLVRATDSFARDLREHTKLVKAVSTRPRVYLPVIVTNAPIYTARYDPPDVSLETGKFRADPEDVKKAPWVRFSKSFTADSGRDFGHRSIFIVNATCLEQFLASLELAPGQSQNRIAVSLR